MMGSSIGGAKQSAEKMQSALAPVAKEVSVFLKKYHEKFTQPRAEIMGETVTKLANKIIKERIEGNEAIGQININSAITAIENELLIEERNNQNNLPEKKRSAKGETIITNFANKLITSMEVEDVEMEVEDVE